jgi:hypothetical protein
MIWEPLHAPRPPNLLSADLLKVHLSCIHSTLQVQRTEREVHSHPHEIPPLAALEYDRRGGVGWRKHVWPLQYQTGGADIENGLRDRRGDIVSAKNTRPIGHDDWIQSQLDAEARFRNAWYSMHWRYHVQNGWNFAVLSRIQIADI